MEEKSYNDLKDSNERDKVKIMEHKEDNFWIGVQIFLLFFSTFVIFQYFFIPFMNRLSDSINKRASVIELGGWTNG